MNCKKYMVPTLSELQVIRYNECGEDLVNLEGKVADLLCEYRRTDSSIKHILVRQSLVDKLCKVQQRLKIENEHLRLLVVEGYRSPGYQERYYLQQLLFHHVQNPTLQFDALLEQVHQLVALPSVAGHPTGGAVDVTLSYKGREVDMGGTIADFSVPEKIPTHSLLVTLEQKMMRLLLNEVMMAEGFAPFYGEWWHFSYGDREWATFYGHSETIFSPIYQ